MNEINKNKNKYKLMYVCIFGLLMVSDDTVLFGTNNNSNFIFLKFLFYFGLSLYLITKYFIQEVKIKKNSIIFLCGIILLVVATAIFSLDFRGAYFYRIIIIIISFLVSLDISKKDFMNIYSKIMIFLSFISILVYFIEITNKSLFQFFPIITNVANHQFYNLYLAVVPVVNYGVPRSYGIFREPGVYAVFLILALIISIFFSGKIKFISTLVLTISLVLTKSTTGYICFLFLLLVLVIKRNANFKDRIIKVSLIIMSGIGIYYLINYTDLIFSDNKYLSVFQKYDNIDKSNDRFASIVLNFSLFLSKPFFGQGITNLENLFAQKGLDEYGVQMLHNTNTILYQFSNYGIFFGLLYMKMLFNFFREKYVYKYISVSVFVIFILVLSGENLTNNPILTLLLFYGLPYVRRKMI